MVAIASPPPQLPVTYRSRNNSDRCRDFSSSSCSSSSVVVAIIVVVVVEGIVRRVKKGKCGVCL